MLVVKSQRSPSRVTLPFITGTHFCPQQEVLSLLNMMGTTSDWWTETPPSDDAWVYEILLNYIGWIRSYGQNKRKFTMEPILLVYNKKLFFIYKPICICSEHPLTVLLTSTVQQVLQQHQMCGTGTGRGSVTLCNANVRTAPVVPGTRMGHWREKKQS